MGNQQQKYEQLIEKVTTWCNNQEDIRGMIIVGSRARTKRPADEWSDLDLVLFSTEPDKYLISENWVGEIGPYWITFIEKTAIGGGKERRVLFEDAVDVDFSIFPLLSLNQLFASDEIRTTLNRGIRVLVDKDRLFERFANLEENTMVEDYSLPSKAEWTEVILDFWYHAVWGAKKLLRGEWWTAKVCIDNDLKQLLLKMTEWHAKAKYGNDYDTWHNGRFFDKWADPKIKGELRKCFARYDSREMQHALKHTMDLFRSVASETTTQFDYDYPVKADEKATEWIYQQFKWRSM
ncbi:aminoglycoside 6-adenylyltransferase [Virgibacillus sp. FSP13]